MGTVIYLQKTYIRGIFYCITALYMSILHNIQIAKSSYRRCHYIVLQHLRNGDGYLSTKNTNKRHFPLYYSLYMSIWRNIQIAKSSYRRCALYSASTFEHGMVIYLQKTHTVKEAITVILQLNK